MRIEARKQTSYTIPGDDVFPEGIAYDPDTRDFFVSSVNTGAIYAADVRDRRMREFLPGGEDGRTTAVGMAVDVAGRLLVAGGATGKAWVYDTASGDLLTSSDNGVENTFLNDVVVVPGGDAYVTDSFDPVLYRLPRTDDGYGELEPFLDLRGSVVEYQEGFNFNGIVASPDGRYVVAVQFNTGQLYRIDLRTKDVRAVAQNGVAINGDGLALDGLDLFAVSNDEILQTRFSSDFLTIGPIERRIRRDNFDSPTTIALVDDHLLVVQSQFDALFGDDEVHLPFKVTRVRIAH
ncbi:MAG: SMP-30/gluconolactonase/LRE family protein [Egibacteraceae bacterium]